MDDRWLSMKEICQYLGVSHDTISRWIKECEMPVTRVGGRWKFKRDNVDAWLWAGGSQKNKQKIGRENESGQ